ncbi:N-acetylmuramoyl-L-alanine amidase [uncultured Hoeflea sp.]|uniref:N-acetylmuramoyl-L-alanine amidase n=1 Tax=uncultured Hoeflea sp. TaxID=538666 RepID=UPI002628659D|nr:N-acetylmuramoyl-L-alanine amidase [uncultured Hoeflea sp.]
MQRFGALNCGAGSGPVQMGSGPRNEKGKRLLVMNRRKVETSGARGALGSVPCFCASTIRHGLAAFLILLALTASLVSPAIAEPEADNGAPLVAIAARMAGDDNRLRLVLDFEQVPEFKVRYLAQPDRVVIDLPETVFAFEPESLSPRGLVKALRYGAVGGERARMVLELAAPARLEVATSSLEADGAIHRLVFDAIAVDPEAFAKLAAQTEWPSTNPDPTPGNASEDQVLTIVIDPGHGGIDGGAEGPAGTMEKDVTLAFAEALKEALEDEDDIRVSMTRTDDKFLSLSARVRQARHAEADLLMSLHADSIRIKSLRGATVYTLSDKASDAMAQSLADQENAGDSLVGASLEDAPEAVAAILVDLARTETRVFSTGLARQVIGSFEGQVRLINNPHRHAGFRVLQAPDVPSVLIELGYLSNRDDEKMLNDETWRTSTARLLAQSVVEYRETIMAGRP